MSAFLKSVAATLVALLVVPVCEARKHETWVEVRSPNFIVVSSAGEKEARKTALHFEQIRAVFRQSLQVANYPTPVLTVLAVKNEDSMRDLLPEYWAKGHSHPAGLFVGRMSQFYAAVDLEAQGINPYKALYHEYYHFLTTPYFPNLPVWLSEGLAEYYGHTEVDDRYVRMGQPDPMLVAGLRTESFIPLDVLLKVDRSSPYYNEQQKASMFYAESWALMHYFLIGDRMVHQPMLLSYLRALDRGKTQDEAATEAFGDLRKLQSELQHYVNQSNFLSMKMAAPLKIEEDQLAARSLSEAEADAYVGGFAVVRGRTDDARAMLEEAVRLDPNLALAYQYLGLVNSLEGRRDKALECVSKAIALDPKNFFTHYLRADLVTYRGMRTSPDSHVEEDLRQAILLNPEFAPSYGLLAVHLSAGNHGNQNFSEALSLAQKAVSLEPGNSTFQLELAEVLGRMKKYDEARVAASRASAQARTPAEKARADTFLAYLQHPDSIPLQRSDEHTVKIGTSELNSARAALRNGNYAAGIQLLQHVVELDATSEDGWNLLGLAYLSSHRIEDAITAFKKQVDVRHNGSYAYNNLGRAYWLNRQYEDAEAAFRKQLQANPSDNFAHANLGGLYLERRKYDQAAMELEKATSIKPSDANLQVNLGTAYLKLGHDEKAMAAFDLAVKLSATPGTWNNIAYQLALKNSHVDMAQQYAQMAVKSTSTALSALKLDQLSTEDLSLVSSIGAYWDTLGWVYFAIGELEKAERYVSSAWELTQQSTVADHLGQIYEKRGEKDKAIQAYALAMGGYRPPDPDTRQRLAALVGGDDRAIREAANHRDDLSALRTVRLQAPGPASARGDLFVLLAPSSPGASGTRVEAVKLIRGDDRLKGIENLLAKASYPLKFPEDRLIKIVRRGTVSCSSGGECSFVMMLPEDMKSTE